MIKTYFHIKSSGSHFFMDSFKTINSPFYDDFFSSTNFFISDKIVIDKNWSYSYKELNDGEKLVSYKVIDSLIKVGIIEEIDIRKELSPKLHINLMKHAFKTFLTKLIKLKRKRVPKKFIENLDVIPFMEAIQVRMYDKRYTHDKLPKSLLGIYSEDIYIFLDSIFAYIVSGTISNRIHDPRNLLAVSRNFIELENINNSSNNYQAVESILEICSESVPKITLFQNKTGNSTVSDSPLYKLGYKHVNIKGEIQLLSKEQRKNKSFKDIQVADETKTLKRLEKIIEFHKSSICKDLRTYYKLTLDFFQEPNGDIESFLNNSEFHKLWGYKRAELRKSFSLSKRTEKITDFISVPATIASIIMPMTSVLPITTWGISKLSALKVKKDFLKSQPWFFFAEKFGDLAVELNQEMNKK